MQHVWIYISMGESNTVVSAYTMYRHLQQYCSLPSIYIEIVTRCEKAVYSTFEKNYRPVAKPFSYWSTFCVSKYHATF